MRRYASLRLAWRAWTPAHHGSFSPNRRLYSNEPLKMSEIGQGCPTYAKSSLSRVSFARGLYSPMILHEENFPAYSLDLNPIEKMWNRVKTLLRSLLVRTPDTLLVAIALNRVHPSDVAGSFLLCGYKIS
jgi:hypothetical protein